MKCKSVAALRVCYRGDNFTNSRLQLGTVGIKTNTIYIAPYILDLVSQVAMFYTRNYITLIPVWNLGVRLAQ